MKSLRQLSSVVLPVPVPPEMRMFSPAEHGRPQKLGRRAGHRALGDQVVDDQLPLGELANRERRAAHGQRRDHRVHAAAIGKAGIHQRLRAIDAPAHVGHDPLDDRFDHGVGNEPPAGVLQVAVALDVNVLLDRRP